MDSSMSPQQDTDRHQDPKRMKSQSYRRQSAPSLVITKALTRSTTLSRESFVVSICPETNAFVQSFVTGSDRTFLLHGQAQLKTGLQTQVRHLFLFSDILVIAKAKSSSQFKQKQLVSLCEVWTAGCLQDVCEGTSCPQRSFVLGWPTSNTLCGAEGHMAVSPPKTKTLPVSNWDSTNEVIRLALQQFGIIGHVKNYQLWVLSKRDNTPYPLIGHEFPFSIQRNHLRSGRDAEDRVCKLCHFILKLRPSETASQRHEPTAATDFPQKSIQRRRSLMTWFWRGPAPSGPDSAPLTGPAPLADPSLSGAPSGCLFGRPLSSICINNTLPQAVGDMLRVLYHVGPWTRGIFRRSAGARAVRELRAALDSGASVPRTREHVLIVAGVFKEFLRAVPRSLLGCELYDEWLEALEEDDDEEEQLQDVQRMLLRLPKDNTVLLRHLLAVLHCIQGNASENQMTSLNLSICIAPSLLWPPGAVHSPEAEGEGTRKICELVKFMIDHSQSMFEEDCGLFGDPPLSHEDHDSEPLTDSSYDSLENELDDTRCVQAPQGSLDSILTFSDYDHENDTETPPNLQNLPIITRHYHIEKLGGDSVIYSSKQDFDHMDSPPTLSSRHRPRRRSEPAVAYRRKLQPHDEPPNSQSHSRDECRRRDVGSGMKFLALEESSSSLSSTPNSPALNHSSIDSLDSLDSLDGERRRTFITDEIPVTVIATPEEDADSPPKELGATKSSGNLHPNSWFKKDWRLTLSHKESVKKTASSGCEKTAVGKASAEKSKRVQSRGFCRGSREQSVEEQRHDRPTGPTGPTGPALSLFKRHQATDPQVPRPRRGSEPSSVLVDRVCSLRRQRLPSDPGLRVSEVDDLNVPEPRFCLSPYATKAVKEYFSSHPRSNPHSSQQVALALVESQRQWKRRCSDPQAGGDIQRLLLAEESLLLAEESYV